MTARIDKLRAERSKNESKIAVLNQRNKEIDETITQIENSEIIGLARNTGMTVEELSEYLKAFRNSGTPAFMKTESEVSVHEEN